MHSSGNLSLNKISLNVFVKTFKHLSPPALKNSTYSNSKGPICFPDFHTIHRKLHLFNLNSPHCTLYPFSINAITPFIFNIHEPFHRLLPDFLSSSTLTFTEPFHRLLPDFLSIIHTYFHCPTFCFKTTNPNISSPQPFVWQF